jgi:glucosyl-3-phosphoglycerate phosphatase
MSRLLLWRHGQTTWNAERRFQGQTDVDLNETGVRQAAEAAPRLAAREPKLIISSDLRRAARTAQALVDLTGLPLRFDPRLRERHFGPWQGLTATEVEQRFPDDYLHWGSAAPIANPAVEAIETMTERVVAALRDASDEAGEGGIAVVVTHGGSARVGVGGLLGWPQETWHTLGVLGNCRVSELWLNPERGWQLEAHNAR